MKQSTAQINNHNFYEVFDSASTQEIKTTSETAEFKRT